MELLTLGGILENKLFKILLAILFYVFILNIIYHLGIFLGINKNLLDMYYLWVAILVLLITVLPVKRSNL
jgi:hypothetical protein